MQGPLEGLDSVFLLSTNYKESIFVNILIVTSVQIRPFSYFFVFSRPKRYKGSPYNKCSPYLYKYLILISEMECPLCCNLLFIKFNIHFRFTCISGSSSRSASDAPNTSTLAPGDLHTCLKLYSPSSCKSFPIQIKGY